MNKEILLYCLIFLFSWSANEQRSNSYTVEWLSNINHTSSSYLQSNFLFDKRALVSLDSPLHASLKNGWSVMELHGRVKSITEDRCSLRDARTEPDKPCKRHIVYHFNELGFLVSKFESTFDFGGEDERYIYDSTGQRVIQIDAISREDQVSSSTLYKYDDRGNIVEELYKRAGKDHCKYICQFDKHNRMVTSEGFALNEGGHRFMTMTKTYDDHGSAIREVSIIKGDTTITTHRYKYDRLNRIVEKVMIYNSRTVNYSRVTTYKFNSIGQVVEEMEKGWPSLKITITYDLHGNWIKKLGKYENSQLPRVDVRTIEYY